MLNKFIYASVIFVLYLFFLFLFLFTCLREHFDKSSLSCTILTQHNSNLGGFEGSWLNSKLEIPLFLIHLTLQLELPDYI
jgi:hypothetical protein